MLPMRELFGSKILEGEAPRHCQQQQQLVAAVACALQQGGSSRKLRRGLERWKRQNGAAADWCDVNAVMRAGEHAAQGQQHVQHQPKRQLQQQQQQDSKAQLQQPQQQQQPQQHAVECCQGSMQLEQLPQICSAAGSSSQRDTQCCPPDEGDTGSGPSGTHENAVSIGGSSKGTAVGQAELPAKCCGCSRHSTAQAESYTKAQEMGMEAHNELVAELCSHPLALPCRMSSDSSAGTQHEQCSRLGTTGNAAVDACCSSGTAVAAGAAAGQPGSNSSSSGRWTLEELIALPADAVRPVSVEDLLAALKQVGRIDNSLASKYEDFRQKYGSGPGEGGRREEAWRWMPMYM